MVGRAYPNDGHRAFPSTAKREFPIFGSDVAGPPVDSLFSDVSLLLHCNGSNASTTIIDDSSNGFTMVANGNAQLETAINKFGTASFSISEIPGVKSSESLPESSGISFF